MVISNIGTIVLSLPTSFPSTMAFASTPAADISTSSQVRLLSLANTCSRLFVGFLADIISPVALYLPSGTFGFARKHHVSRIIFLTASTALLALTFIWMGVGIRSQEGLWALRSFIS